MTRLTIIASTVFAITTIAAGSAFAGAAPSDKTVQKVVKTLVSAIRYNKDDLAAKQIGFSRMAQEVMGDAWKDVKDGDRKELSAGLETIVRKVSFQKGRDMFKHLDAMRYDKVRMEGDLALCKTTVVVHKSVKKAEIIIDFVLAEEGGGWRVVDTILVGQSTAEGIREDQIEPLIEEGGVPAVMKALRDKLAEIG